MLHGRLYTDMVYRHGSALYCKILRLGQYQKAWSGAVFQGTVRLNPVRDMGVFFAIVLMLTVIVSLFPLTVIKSRKYMHGMCWEIRFLDDNIHTA